MSNPNLWSHDTFAGYMRSSPRKAFEFRRDTLGNPIPDEYLTPEEKEALANGTTLPESTPEDAETLKEIINPLDLGLDLVKKTPEDAKKLDLDLVKKPKVKEEGYTEADLKEILKKNNIKFFGGAKLEALAELCIKNNLL